MPSPCGQSPVEAAEMTCSVLNRFVGIPEQTYKEFLTTFTCLPQERHDCEVRSDHPQGRYSTSQEMQTTQEGHYVADAAVDLDEPEQLTIGEGITVGCCHSLTYSGRVQVDNFFNSSDIDTDSDNEETSPSVLLFPGEADTELAGGSKPIVRNICLEIHTSSRLQRTTDEHLGDDIQPFSLDQTFDYDRVVLTSKLSAAAMDFLKRRGRDKAEEAASAEQT